MDYKILMYLRWLATGVVSDYQDNMLSPLLKAKANKFYDALEKIIKWEELTKDNALQLGFMCCDDTGTEDELWLIPAWLYPIIPEGLVCYDMKNTQFEFHRKETPFENFYGCLRFGIKL